MPVTYEKADAVVNAIVKKVIKAYHKDLAEAGVTVGCLFANNPEGAAVKLHGYPCAATVRKTSLKDRVAGLEDAQIVIDEERWKELNEAERTALIDHELFHLVVRRDEHGAIDYDDHQRPKLKLKLHDAEIGVFKTIIERHGPAALDTKISEAFIEEYGQLVLWTKDKQTVG